MSKVIICKQCGLLSLNGTNFCSRKCRLAWVKAHNYRKKDWKRIEGQHEDMLIKMSGGIDMEDFGPKVESFDFFKLPSAELTNAELIDAMLETGRHVYLSTGCHSEYELEAAFARLPSEG